MKEDFHVLTYLLIGNLRIDLGGLNMGMSENTANSLFLYSVG